jgi:hypothetical protein
MKWPHWISLVIAVWRHLGFQWLLGRIFYLCKIKFGWFRLKLPVCPWEKYGPERIFKTPCQTSFNRSNNKEQSFGGKFFFKQNDFEKWKTQLLAWNLDDYSPVKDANRVVNGELRYFNHQWLHTGFPPAWHRNPTTGIQIDSHHHWSQLSDFEFGDIKYIWEPNRFSFVFVLVRAYARTEDEKYAEAFWIAIESWKLKNPPQMGVNWKCGQETSFRTMAWCFGLHAFLNCSVTTPNRISKLASMLYVHGERVEGNLGYAISQKNNHGISEAVGLWTLGILFPEFKRANYWRELGRKWIIKQVEVLVYEDGSFSQQSINYHRVMLHDCLWAIRLGQINNDPLPQSLVDKTISAGKWLEQMILASNGEAPNYGSNDGALLFPLSNSNYEDYRPVVQSIAKLNGCKDLPFSHGIWDEESLWFWGLDAIKDSNVGPKCNDDFSAAEGGYFLFKGDHSSVFTRCVNKFRHRPSQADLLHVDLWWKGANVAIDAGTFSYNEPPPWDNGLARTNVHNTVTVDGKDQAERCGRFLLLPWPKGRVTRQTNSVDGTILYWEGEHDGYRRLKPPVTHRRAIVRLPSDCWVIVDSVLPVGCQNWEVNWLFPDVPYEITELGNEMTKLEFTMKEGAYSTFFQVNDSSQPVKIVRADEHSVRGWQSRFYRSKEPALSVKVTSDSLNVALVTIFGPSPLDVSYVNNCCLVVGPEFSARLNISKGISEECPLVESINVEFHKDKKEMHMVIE